MLTTWLPPGEAHIAAEFARWNACLCAAAGAYLCRKVGRAGGGVSFLQLGRPLGHFLCAPPTSAHPTRNPAPRLAPAPPLPPKQDAYWEHCADTLSPAEVAWLRGCDNAPVKMLMVMSGLLAR
jgi:hypothetical protein